VKGVVTRRSLKGEAKKKRSYVSLMAAITREKIITVALAKALLDLKISEDDNNSVEHSIPQDQEEEAEVKETFEAKSEPVVNERPVEIIISILMYFEKLQPDPLILNQMGISFVDCINTLSCQSLLKPHLQKLLDYISLRNSLFKMELSQVTLC